MAKKPNTFENYFKNSFVGRGLRYLQDQQKKQQFGFVNEEGFIDAPRPSSGPVESAAASFSEGASDFQHEFAGSDIVTAAAEDPEASGYTTRINEIGNRWIRDPSGRVVYSHGKWVSDRDKEVYEAAKEKEETTSTEGTVLGETTDTALDTVENISTDTFTDSSDFTGNVTAGASVGTAAGGVEQYEAAKETSVGQAEDEALELMKKGRRATILTKPSGLLGAGEEEGQTRRRRALIGG